MYFRKSKDNSFNFYEIRAAPLYIVMMLFRVQNTP